MAVQSIESKRQSRAPGAGRKRVLDGEICYKLYLKLGSLKEVRMYLHEAGIIAPNHTGYFFNSNIAAAIRTFKPDASLTDLNVLKAQQQMAKLRKQLLGEK